MPEQDIGAPLSAQRRSRRGLVRLRQGTLIAILLGLIGYRYATRDHFPRSHAGGRSEIAAGERIVYLRGTPEEMGTQHGRLLKWSIRRMLWGVIGYFREEGDLDELYAGARRMEPFIPGEFVVEMKALAKAAGVAYRDILVASIFGDIERVQLCKTFVVFGPATRTGEMIVGRNFDFASYGVAQDVAVILHQRPAKGHAMVSVTWAGICAGWTIINDAGLLVANNTAGGKDTAPGVPTLFMNRLVAQRASTVEEGIVLVREAKRACGTNMTIAGGKPEDAAIVEFDAGGVEVVRPERGYVVADNAFRRLHVAERHRKRVSQRCNRLREIVEKHHGRIDRSMNLAAEKGAYMSMNLHSVLFFPRDMVFRVAQGEEPAAEGPYQTFRIGAERLAAASQAP